MYVSPSVLMVYGLPRFGDNKHEDITATPAASIMADNKNGIYFMADFSPCALLQTVRTCFRLLFVALWPSDIINR